MNVIVRRSALKMWLLALGGLPLLVISVDVLTQRRITRWLTDLVFRPEDVQIYEPRDVIFAWVMLLFALVLVGWGLKELFVPTKVIECHDEGIMAKLNGPLRPASMIPWNNIRDVAAADIDDEGDAIPLLVISVFSRDHLPDYPWGARWVEERELGILAQDWGEDPQAVAERIADYAIESVRRRKHQTTRSLEKEPG